MAKTFNILIADDNVHVRKFLIRELAKPHYRIFEAANHQQLFSILYNQPDGIDLIVLDPAIPYIHGIEILQRLLKLAPPVPVIVYTCLQEYQDHPVVQQMSAFVEKEGSVDDLQQTIDQVLQAHYAVFDPDHPGMGAGPNLDNQRDG